jgi:CBS domain-containing protein
VTHRQQNVWTIDIDASVFDAVHAMSEHGIGALPVVDEGRLAGIVSERDCARKLVLSGKSPVDTRVHDIMSTELVTVTGDYTVEQCMQLMTTHRIRHLPVMQAGVLVGIVSIGDLVYEIIAQQQRVLEELERYVAG